MTYQPQALASPPYQLLVRSEVPFLGDKVGRQRARGGVCGSEGARGTEASRLNIARPEPLVESTAGPGSAGKGWTGGWALSLASLRH